MFIRYTPAEGEPQQFFFKLAKLLSVEAEKIEEVTGWPFDEFQTRLMRGTVRARRVLLWVLLKRQHPTIKLADINVPVDGITVEFDRDEFDSMLTELNRARAANGDDEQAEQLDAVIAQFTRMRDEAPEPENGPKGEATVSGAA